ncbi:LytTR family transcriptional regulator DNA-binding domain-containing protein [uncultured Draconibacterium sp.]|uniref:LytTR family transcriptional regulator DNA-binding domain-containing protein n=1 Tax=uncultured Draconibacterium sp. TaxID=1573823 RepID=UPI002AA7CC3A|nr:LytTR family transcriptional regulator DNA-binding domain-containing protein [uncultured Draconibacterium sp.]
MNTKKENSITKWFLKPFPVVESAKDKLLISIGSGVVVVGILSLIKPFGIESYNGIFFFLVGFGIIDFIITALNLFLLPLIVPRFLKSTSFTTGKNLLVILWILLNISLVNYFYNDIMIAKVYPATFENNSSIFKWVTMTFSVGIIPVIFALYYIEKRFFLRNSNLAEILNKETKKTNSDMQAKQIQLKSNKDTTITINSADLICVKAEGGNYASVYWHEENSTRTELIRMTLTGFMEKAETTEALVRCHKSYIINLDKVKSYQGNARSILVQLEGLDFSVPLSRSFPRNKLKKRN